MNSRGQLKEQLVGLRAPHREDHYYGNMSRFREHVWFNLRDLPLFVWRDASVQHFDTLSGDYVWPTRTNSCVPFRDVALDDANQLHSWYPALQVTAVRALPRLQGSRAGPASSDMLRSACILLMCIDSCMPTRGEALGGTGSPGLLVYFTAGTF